MYDKYFSGARPLNKILYKVLYTSEILPYKKHGKGERSDGDGDKSPVTPIINKPQTNAGATTESSQSTRAGGNTMSTTTTESNKEQRMSATGQISGS